MEHGPTSLKSLHLGPGSLVADRYEICKRIGSGGMGEVFRVLDRELDGEVVALKLLHPHLAENEEVFRRFRNEVLVARSLSHPNVVRTHDIGRAQGNVMYISMEYVDGVSLRDKLESFDTAHPEASSSGMGFEQAVSILFQILSGVSYAHGRGIIHRDLKPANVIIGNAGEVKLADFGTARILGMDTSITRAGTMIGTPDYMSPEQIKGEKLDHLCDIYSLGIIAYELVVGRKPFSADTPVAVAFKHLNDPLPDIETFNPGVPLWYQEAVKRAAAKDRQERFPSASAFAGELVRHLPGIAGSTGFFAVDESHSLGTVTGATYSGSPAQRDPKKNDFELGDSQQAAQDSWTLDFAPKASSDSWSTTETDSEALPVLVSKMKAKRGTVAFLGLLFLISILALGVRLYKPLNNKIAHAVSPMVPEDSTFAKALSLLLAIRPEEAKKREVFASLSTEFNEEDTAEREGLRDELLGISRSDLAPGDLAPGDLAPGDLAFGELASGTGENKKLDGAASGSEVHAEGVKAEAIAPDENAKKSSVEVATKERVSENIRQKERQDPLSESQEETLAEGKQKVAKDNSVAQFVEETSQATAKPTVSPTPAPSPEPSPLATPLATPQATPLAPQIVSGSLELRIGKKNLEKEAVSVDSLASLAWDISAKGLAGKDSSNIAEELYLNIFSVDESSVVARIKTTKLKPSDDGVGVFEGVGNFAVLKAKNPSAGSYRADLVYQGEVLASKPFSLYKASVSYSSGASKTSSSTTGGRIAIVTGAAVIEHGETNQQPKSNNQTKNSVPRVTAESTQKSESPEQQVVSVPNVSRQEPLVLEGSSLASSSGTFRSATPYVVERSNSLDSLPPARGYAAPPGELNLPAAEPENRGLGGVVNEGALRTSSESQVSSTTRETYSGFFMFMPPEANQRERRTLRLELETAGKSIGGRAVIDGFSPFIVVGKIHERGIALELQNEKYWMRLSASRRGASVLRGQYSFPALKQRGSWEASK